MLGHEAIDIVLQRVRDPHGTAHSRQFVLSQLSDCQRLINIQIAAYTIDFSFTVEPQHILYTPLSEIMPFAGRILTIRDTETNDELESADWLDLTYAMPNWLRYMGGNLEHWGYIGRDMIFLWPALRTPMALTITAAQMTPDLSNESDPFLVADQYMPAILDLCELHLLTKQRSSEEIWSVTAAKAKVTEQMGAAAKAQLTEQAQTWESVRPPSGDNES